MAVRLGTKSGRGGPGLAQLGLRLLAGAAVVLAALFVLQRSRGLGLDAGFGRKLRGHKVTSAGLGDYVERIARAYVAQRGPDERFPQWVARADEADLR